MKHLLLGIILASTAVTAYAVLYLPRPELTSEVQSDGKVDIAWTYDSATEPCTNFQVIVYKMHKATGDEKYILAQSDFEYLQSTGTMKRHEDLGAIWDTIEGNPGWYVKFPLYMKGAMGIDTFNYFAGSDNDDIFGGAYMISPDFDLRNVTDPTINIKSNLGNEATSVTGGFTIWTWNTDWWDEKNIDYKPVPGQDFHFDDINNEHFILHEEQLVPDEYLDRTRVMFYGAGNSAYWIDDFEVSINMKAGDKVDKATAVYMLDKDAREFTIDTSADTDNDYTYAYEVRAVRIDHRDLTDNDYIRFISPLKEKEVIGATGIGTTIADSRKAIVRAINGQLHIEGADSEKATVYTLDGRQLWTGNADKAPRLPGRGAYIVKVGTTTTKVIY